MTDLIHLADEIILQVVSNLTSLPFANLDPQAFQLNRTPLNKWPETLSSYAAKGRNFKDAIQTLSHTCPLLHALLTPTLCSHMSLISQERGDRFFHLSNTLWSTRDLADHIKTTHIRYASIKDLYFVFFLPNIHTVSIQGCLPPKNPGDLKYNSFRRPGISPVKVLHFTNCGLSEKPLAWVLSWPRALREFWYEVADSLWKEFSFDDPLPNDFSCAGVRQALSSQKKSLQIFAFTRFHRPNCMPLSRVPPIDLHDFERLQDFRTYYHFVNGNTDVQKVLLPRNLESLEI
ncbi:hypothetical protein DL95DRAFT_460454 [Leptodontidium sp. 2 PMI_412]|nr:hypothetical protein DL95DRAFT_460454 [Leptodontidium sp. 2 PMI_412]